MSASSTLERDRLREDRRWPASPSAVTADRRRDELSALLERRGARVVLAPALRIVPVADDTELHAATASCVDRRRTSWSPRPASASAAGSRPPRAGGSARRCVGRLGGAYLIARGPKARGRGPRRRAGRGLVAATRE